MAAVLLYVLNDRTKAKDFYAEMVDMYPGISAQNPVLHLQLLPIENVLEERRDSGEWDGPVSTVEIFRLLDQQG